MPKKRPHRRVRVTLPRYVQPYISQTQADRDIRALMRDGLLYRGVDLTGHLGPNYAGRPPIVSVPIPPPSDPTGETGTFADVLHGQMRARYVAAPTALPGDEGILPISRADNGGFVGQLAVYDVAELRTALPPPTHVKRAVSTGGFVVEVIADPNCPLSIGAVTEPYDFTAPPPPDGNETRLRMMPAALTAIAERAQATQELLAETNEMLADADVPLPIADEGADDTKDWV